MFRYCKAALISALIFVVFWALTGIHVQPSIALEDNSPPQILSFNITPTQINTSTTDQVINITLRLKDDLAGVKAFDDKDPGFNSFVRLQPLISTQILDFFDLHRVSGDKFDGIYTATATLPKYSKVGIWTSTIFVNDKIGNNHWFLPEEISTLFPNSHDVFLVNTAESNSVLIERNWELKSSIATVTFPAGTVITKKEGGSFAFYQMVNQEITVDQDTPTAGLDGTPIAALKLGIPGLNLSFSQNVPITFKVNPKYNGYNLQIQSLAEGGSVWANETIVPVINGTATFTVDHATKFVGILGTPPKTLMVSAKPKTYAKGTSTKRKGKRKVATAKLRWKVKDNSSKAKVTLKIQKKIKSKARAKKKARYLSLYNKFRKSNKKKALKYMKAYKKTKTVYHKTIKTINLGLTDINKWQAYNWKTKTPGLFEFLVFATDTDGNSQQNVAKGSIRIK